MKTKIIRVHIADDHQILIDGIVAVLKKEEDIEVVGHSLNGQQVLDWFSVNEADLLVLDINMPEVDGIEVLKKFHGSLFKYGYLAIGSKESLIWCDYANRFIVVNNEEKVYKKIKD